MTAPVMVIIGLFFLIGITAGIIGVILSIYFALSHAPRLWWGLAALALVIALVLTLYAGAVVRPKVDSIRTVAEEANPDPARKAEFERLHRLSVAINGGVMVLDLLALLCTAAALTPHG